MVKALQKNSEKDRPPANEHGRRVKIRDGRATFQTDAKQQADGVDREAKNGEVKSVASKYGRPNQPATAGKDEDQHIQHHALVKGSEGVEEGIESSGARYFADRLL